MTKERKIKIFISAVILIAITATCPLTATVTERLPPETRCSICGMFVAQYPAWIVQIHHADGSVQFFDGVKDMMVYYFNPSNFDSASHGEITEIWLKDYYSLNWFDARSGFFVIGSDVYGPMGHEFIPFNSRPAADSFFKDHHGKKILAFDEITQELVDSMRTGQKMR